MTVRAGMLPLIQRVRGLTGAADNEYTLGAETYWSDAHIQALLDTHTATYYYEPLHTLSHVGAGGTALYLDYYLAQGDWDATTVTVQDATGTTLDASGYTVDALRGWVTFASDQAGSARYANLTAYDVYAAAADLCEAWAARLARSFDYSGEGQSFSRSQMTRELRAQADRYRALAWPVTSPMTRSDVRADDGDTRHWPHVRRVRG